MPFFALVHAGGRVASVTPSDFVFTADISVKFEIQIN